MINILIGVVIGLILGGWAQRREAKKFRCRRGCCAVKRTR